MFDVHLFSVNLPQSHAKKQVSAYGAKPLTWCLIKPANRGPSQPGITFVGHSQFGLYRQNCPHIGKPAPLGRVVFTFLAGSLIVKWERLSTMMHLASFGDSGTAGEPASNTIRYFSSVEIAANGFQIAENSLIY